MLATFADLMKGLELGFGLTSMGVAFRLERYSTGPRIDGTRDIVIPYQALYGVFKVRRTTCAIGEVE
jgi:hypothetical protein